MTGKDENVPGIVSRVMGRAHRQEADGIEDQRTEKYNGALLEKRQSGTGTRRTLGGKRGTGRHLIPLGCPPHRHWMEQSDRPVSGLDECASVEKTQLPAPSRPGPVVFAGYSFITVAGAAMELATRGRTILLDYPLNGRGTCLDLSILKQSS